MGIFYHDKDLPANILDEIKIRLNKTFHYTIIFNDPDDRGKFALYLSSALIVQKIIFIICSKQAKSLCAITKTRKQCYRVYELQLEHKSSVQSNSNAWRIFYCFDELFAQILSDIKTPNVSANDNESLLVNGEDDAVEELTSLGVFNSNSKERSFRYLSTESLKFLRFYLCIEKLIGMEHDRTALDGMLHHCRHYYKRNAAEVKKIDEFKKNYHQTKAILYYTKSSFVFRQVNQAFRCEDIEHIFKFRCYITDLHQHIGQLNKERSISPQNKIVLYRGKMLLTSVLQQLYDNVNKLISMNSFLSTTRDIKVAKMFAGIGDNREGYESALFELYIDEATTIRNSYADITKLAVNPDECEILFTIGSVWLLEMMERKKDGENSYWMIRLRLTNDLDSQLAELENLTDGCTFLSIANILRELGEYSNATNFYLRMLEDSSLKGETRGLVYYNMGLLGKKQGQYMEALNNFRTAENLIPTIAISYNSQSSDCGLSYAHNRLPTKLRIFNNIGQSYEKKGDYERARTYYMQALAEQGDSIEKAIVHNNLGSLEFDQGNYEEAHRNHTQAVHLGKNHELVRKFEQDLNIVNEHIINAAEQ